MHRKIDKAEIYKDTSKSEVAKDPAAVPRVYHVAKNGIPKVTKEVMERVRQDARDPTKKRRYPEIKLD